MVAAEVHTPRESTDGDFAAVLHRVVAATCFAALVLLGIVLAARFLTTGFGTALSLPTMFAAGCLLAVLAGASRRAMPLAIQSWKYADWLPTAIAIPTAMVLITAAPSLLGALAVLSPLACMALARLPTIRHKIAKFTALRRVAPTAHKARPVATAKGVAEPATEPNTELDAELDAELDERIMQQWTRRLDDGWDVLEGFQRAQVPRGTRVVQFHVAVCPAFDGQPEVSTEAMEGDIASIRVAEATPFGLRLEARLDRETTAAEAIAIAIVARSTIAALR